MIPKEEPRGGTSHVLPDVLESNLKVVFCGIATGTTSARVSAYYAGPGNKFWKTLYTVGLTPHQLRPEEYTTLPQYGIGLTDLAKYTSGPDLNLSSRDFAVAPFEEKIRKFSPKVLCFNGKKAAKTFLGTDYVEFGVLGKQIGETRLFVAPSTSGAANGHWDIAYWQQLAEVYGRV
jgi:TDG/mug DNA glycosylase family protein